MTPREGFEVAFRHDFDDGAVVDARFEMIWIAPNLFRVNVAGATVGNGYVFDSYCHYHMKISDAFVEVSYSSDGGVFGSSTRNAEGNYVARKEILRRTAA